MSIRILHCDFPKQFMYILRNGVVFLFFLNAQHTLATTYGNSLDFTESRNVRFECVALSDQFFASNKCDRV